MSQSSDDDTFLARWSRQKQRAKRAPISPVAAPEAATPVRESEAPTVDLEALPKIDELTADSDITMFLQKGVPDALNPSPRQSFRVALEE